MMNTRRTYRFPVVAFPQLHLDRILDEVRVALDDLVNHALVGEVERPLLVGVERFEMQADRGSELLLVDVLELELSPTARAPAHAAGLTRAPGLDLHLVGHHEARIEPDAELPDEIG